jgi:prepilin peptidase dependent protein B
MRAPFRSAASRAAQHGLSVVELLVGAAVGLLIVAAATTLLTGHLRENRSLLLEARLMQDLRTAADLVTRDLRRAGYWGAATDGVWTAGAVAVLANPYAAVAPSAAASDAVNFRYSRDAAENGTVDGNEQFGYRLRAGAIELQLGNGNWQTLTDAGTLRVSEFSVTPTVQDISLQRFCATDCPPGSIDCPPHQQVRSLAVVIAGRLATDARVTRSIRSEVRLRNDAIIGTCGA